MLSATLAASHPDIGRDSFLIDIVLFFAMRASDNHYEVSGPNAANFWLFSMKALDYLFGKPAFLAFFLKFMKDHPERLIDNQRL